MMISLIVFILCFSTVLVVGVLSARSDFRGMVIPNEYSVIVLAAFVVAYLATNFFGVLMFYSLSSHLLAGGLVFGVTLALFGLGMIGAADSKLTSVYALWLGMHGVLVFLFYMALLGGILALVALYIGKKKPFKDPLVGSWVDQVQGGASKIPYGIAIVGGVLASFVKLGYLSVSFYSSFL